ncbi:hypothetical protein YC2023_048355 [Brassica napus]
MQKRSVTRLVKPRNFIHPDDTVILEDESERVQLGMAAGVSVDIMSGLNDPANSALPQQNIDKYSEAESKLDFVERTLRWRHLAPTAPNTLG